MTPGGTAVPVHWMELVVVEDRTMWMSPTALPDCAGVCRVGWLAWALAYFTSCLTDTDGARPGSPVAQHRSISALGLCPVLLGVCGGHTVRLGAGAASGCAPTSPCTERCPSSRASPCLSGAVSDLLEAGDALSQPCCLELRPQKPDLDCPSGGGS